MMTGGLIPSYHQLAEDSSIIWQTTKNKGSLALAKVEWVGKFVADMILASAMASVCGNEKLEGFCDGDWVIGVDLTPV